MEIGGIIATLRQLFQDFQAGWYIGVATVLYLLIQILRGKAGFNIPLVTKFFDKLPNKNIKTWVLLFLFGVAGGLVTLGSQNPSFLGFMDGALGGITVGLTTIGTRHAIKVTTESNSVQKLKSQVKAVVNKG